MGRRRTCLSCNGTGRVVIEAQPGVRKEVTCMACNGSGVVSE